MWKGSDDWREEDGVRIPKCQGTGWGDLGFDGVGAVLGAGSPLGDEGREGSLWGLGGWLPLGFRGSCGHVGMRRWTSLGRGWGQGRAGPRAKKKKKFTGTQPNSFICRLLIYVFSFKWQNEVFMADSIYLSKPKIFTVWCLSKEFVGPYIIKLHIYYLQNAAVSYLHTIFVKCVSDIEICHSNVNDSQPLSHTTALPSLG